MSAARNAGLDIAQGEWIGFVDPDDYVELDMYEFLYHAALATNADIAACSWRDCYVNEKIPYQKTRYHDTVDRKTAIPREVRDGIYLTCNKIFSRQCSKNLHYREGCVNGEDRLFALQAICQANRITYCFEDKYNYCHRKNSAGTKKFTPADYQLLAVCDEIKDIFKKYAPKKIGVAYRQTVFAYLQLLAMMNFQVKNYLPYGERLLSLLRKNWFSYVIKNQEISAFEKFKLTLLSVSPLMYKCLRRFNQITKPEKTLSS